MKNIFFIKQTSNLKELNLFIKIPFYLLFVTFVGCIALNYFDFLNILESYYWFFSVSTIGAFTVVNVVGSKYLHQSSNDLIELGYTKNFITEYGSLYDAVGGSPDELRRGMLSIVGIIIGPSSGFVLDVFDRYGMFPWQFLLMILCGILFCFLYVKYIDFMCKRLIPQRFICSDESRINFKKYFKGGHRLVVLYVLFFWTIALVGIIDRFYIAT
ncbi:MAG: hypothetical protein RLZZ230_814 [Candidatus Parcubacteria bacterium]|jgi:hypothetical protein